MKVVWWEDTFTPINILGVYFPFFKAVLLMDFAGYKLLVANSFASRTDSNSNSYKCQNLQKF